MTNSHKHAQKPENKWGQNVN